MLGTMRKFNSQCIALLIEAADFDIHHCKVVDELMEKAMTEATDYTDDASANLISYAIVASTNNRRMTADEREAIREVMREAAMELNVKLMLVLQGRYKMTFELTASNSGKRTLPLLEDEVTEVA